MKTMTNIRHFLNTTSLALTFALVLGAAHPASAGEGSKSMLIFESTAASKTAGEIVVAGTSSIHDWEVVTKEIVGTLEIPAPTGDEGALVLTSNLPVAAQVSVRSESLDSGKGGMDKKMYKALKADQHQESGFILYSLERVLEPSALDDGITHEAKGKLTVAGKTRLVRIPVTIHWNAQKQAIRVIGQVDLLMTDFGIDPPRALLGTLKTGNAITVSFDWMPELIL